MDSIQILTQQKFPPQLLEIPQLPEKLYFRGSLPSFDTPFLTVVGSRNYTGYGKEACEKIIYELRGSPLAIVSGLALGIDSIAHKSALEAGLTTLAFPGSGLNPNVLYPASNRLLAEKIVASGGALVSEFEPDFKATPYSFPQRNRLMAGISRGILVIEAGEKSGTLITARLATEYNRDVFVVPGSIFSRNSLGSHQLLKLGGIPVASGEDVLREWGLSSNNDSDNDNAKRMIENCSKEEKRILEFLREPLTKDELIQRSELLPHEINTLLSIMELKGIIKESTGKIQAIF